MAAIAELALPPGADGGRPWPAVAAAIRRHAAARGFLLRDAVVLVPYAALIDPLRAALAEAGGWQPRVETVQTLAEALGPAPDPRPGQCTGDAALDRLQAQRWLQPLAAADEAVRTHAATLLADAAALLVEAAAQRPPQARAAWWAAVHEALPVPADGPGALEGALLRTALAWAADAPPPATDRLFEVRPAAWYVVRIGGADALADALLATSPCGGARIDLDPIGDDLFAPAEGAAAPRLIEAEDFEAEAWTVAAEVLQALAAPAGRIALVALDRVLVRRVAALLRRAGIDLDDETGWKLSTTAAAGRVLARLRAAAVRSTADERLDWLKRWPPALAQPAALRALEALWRGGRNARVGAVERRDAHALWTAAQQRLQAWHGGRERPLADWLQLLQLQLAEDGDADSLQADAAGVRLLQLVQQLASAAAPTAWRAALEHTRLDLAGFTHWLEALCEQTTLQRLSRRHSRVVLTPLARAVGRPFAHVVLAGVDARNLGRGPAPGSLIADALAQRLGLPTAAERLRRQRLALVHLLRQPVLTLTWRRADGDAPMGPADEVQAVRDAWARAGRPLAVQVARAATVPVAARPVARPLPVAAGDLPRALSASAVDRLRQCPYRFFARHVLRLGEVEELERPADKRAYGDWLHAALHRFHGERRPGQDDLAALHAAADAAEVDLGLDRADMLPFRASLAAVLPAYLAWLAEHEAAGWTWAGGEEERAATPPSWAPQTLGGRIDRIDLHRDGRRLVLDYKTSAADALRARVADPLEDTQLAFYAALLGAGDGGASSAVAPIEAAYLALDDRKGTKAVMHPDVADSAQVLVERLADELRRLRAGAALPALGEGSACETCESRGLCRRDHWPAPAAAAADGSTRP